MEDRAALQDRVVRLVSPTFPTFPPQLNSVFRCVVSTIECSWIIAFPARFSAPPLSSFLRPHFPISHILSLSSLRTTQTSIATFRRQPWLAHQQIVISAVLCQMFSESDRQPEHCCKHWKSHHATGRRPELDHTHRRRIIVRPHPPHTHPCPNRIGSRFIARSPINTRQGQQQQCCYQQQHQKQCRASRAAVCGPPFNVSRLTRIAWNDRTGRFRPFNHGSDNGANVFNCCNTTHW